MRWQDIASVLIERGGSDLRRRASSLRRDRAGDHAQPGSLADLAAHRCSAYRHPSTGKVLPWRVKLGDQPADQPVVPAICSNDELFELQAVLAGKVLGQLAGVTAAQFIRAGQLVPILVEHMPDYANYFVYFGSRASQPARARAFIDLAVQRLGDRCQYVLTERDLQIGRRRGSQKEHGRATRLKGS